MNTNNINHLLCFATPAKESAWPMFMKRDLKMNIPIVSSSLGESVVKL